MHKKVLMYRYGGGCGQIYRDSNVFVEFLDVLDDLDSEMVCSLFLYLCILVLC